MVWRCVAVVNTRPCARPQSRTYLDALGRTLRNQTEGFDGQGAAPTLVSDTEYNTRGQVARKSKPYVLGGTPVWTSFTYDVLGRVTRQEQPDSDAPGGVAVTRTSYNGLSYSDEAKKLNQ